MIFKIFDNSKYYPMEKINFFPEIWNFETSFDYPWRDYWITKYHHCKQIVEAKRKIKKFGAETNIFQQIIYLLVGVNDEETTMCGVIVAGWMEPLWVLAVWFMDEVEIKGGDGECIVFFAAAKGVGDVDVIGAHATYTAKRVSRRTRT